MLVSAIYFVFARMPSDRYWRRFKSVVVSLILRVTSIFLLLSYVQSSIIMKEEEGELCLVIIPVLYVGIMCIVACNQSLLSFAGSDFTCAS